jgi:hypothetical protein
MDTNDAMEQKKQEKYRVGVTILILLAVFTLGEYGVSAVGANWLGVFVLIALLKAFLVLRDYMHIGRLFSSEEEH